MSEQKGKVVLDTPYEDLTKIWTTILRNLKNEKELSATTCAQCLKVVAETLQCARCKFVRYCGTECQKAAWEHHKVVCKDKIEYKLLGQFLRRVGTYVIQKPFASILNDMKKQLPKTAAVVINYEDILAVSPSIVHQTDHLIWRLIGGTKAELCFLGSDAAKVTDNDMRLVINYKGKTVRAFRAGGTPVTLAMTAPGGALMGAGAKEDDSKVHDLPA